MKQIKFKNISFLITIRANYFNSCIKYVKCEYSKKKWCVFVWSFLDRVNLQGRWFPCVNQPSNGVNQIFTHIASQHRWRCGSQHKFTELWFFIAILFFFFEFHGMCPQSVGKPTWRCKSDSSVNLLVLLLIFHLL